MEEIATQAQVSKPVVYEHFGGKEGLYAVVVDRARTATQRWVCAAATASRSTRSFIGSPECPLTQRKLTFPRERTSLTNGSQRSRLATGFLALVSQPRASQPCHQRSRKQLTT